MLYIQDSSGAQCPCSSIHGIFQMTRMFCFRSMMFQFSSAVNSRKAAGIAFFLPHIHAWHCPHIYCNLKVCFQVFRCRRKVCGCHFRFWGVWQRHKLSVHLIIWWEQGVRLSSSPRLLGFQVRNLPVAGHTGHYLF